MDNKLEKGALLYLGNLVFEFTQRSLLEFGLVRENKNRLPLTKKSLTVNCPLLPESEAVEQKGV